MRITAAFSAPLALALSCAFLPGISAAQNAAATATAASPDGSLALTVSTDNDGRPTYSLTRKGKLLVGASRR